MENPDFLRPAGFLDPDLRAWIDHCRGRYRTWFEIADETNELALRTLFQLDAHNQVIEQVLSATLYLRTVHNYQAAILTLERGMISQSRILARALLDSLFPLVAIAKDKEFARTYAENHTLEQLRYFRKAKRLTGARIPEVDDPRHESRAEQLAKEVEEKDIRKISTEDLARRAGLSEWYLTAYSLLSGTVHARAGDLEEYLVLSDENVIKELDWGPRTKGLRTVMMSVLESMFMAVEHVKSISTDYPHSVLSALRARLESLAKDEMADLERAFTR